MNKKEKNLLWVMVIILVISIVITYYNTITKGSFEVINIEPAPDEQVIE
jgi:hypothetical protein